MKDNPANSPKRIEEFGSFLGDGSQQADAKDIDTLTDFVYELIMAADRQKAERGIINFDKLEDEINLVVLQAMALVLGGVIGGGDEQAEEEAGNRGIRA